MSETIKPIFILMENMQVPDRGGSYDYEHIVGAYTDEASANVRLGERPPYEGARSTRRWVVKTNLHEVAL